MLLGVAAVVTYMFAKKYLSGVGVSLLMYGCYYVGGLLTSLASMLGNPLPPIWTILSWPTYYALLDAAMVTIVGLTVVYLKARK